MNMLSSLNPHCHVIMNCAETPYQPVSGNCRAVLGFVNSAEVVLQVIVILQVKVLHVIILLKFKTNKL